MINHIDDRVVPLQPQEVPRRALPWQLQDDHIEDHIDGEADLLPVLSRLAGRYAGLRRVAPTLSWGLEVLGNGNALVSAFGSSCE